MIWTVLKPLKNKKDIKVKFNYYVPKEIYNKQRNEVLIGDIIKLGRIKFLIKEIGNTEF